MKKLFFIMLVLALVGCSDRVDQAQINAQMPPELQDCKSFYVRVDGTQHFVMRCPNSTVSTDHNHGKYRKRTIVIDGVEYEAKETPKGK